MATPLHELSKEEIADCVIERDKKIAELEEKLETNIEARWDANRENERLEELLRAAKCPDKNCIAGVIPHGPTPDGEWIAQQCQWCTERKAALKEDGDEQNSDDLPGVR